MSKKSKVGQVFTRSIISGVGARVESYEVKVRDEFGNLKNLLLSPLAFFEATRRHKLYIKGDPSAAYPKISCPALAE